MRSRWKGRFAFGFASPSLRGNFRKVYVSPALLGTKVRVHDGRRYFYLHLREPMLGLKIGLLCPTKVIGSSIHQRGNRKKK